MCIRDRVGAGEAGAEAAPLSVGVVGTEPGADTVVEAGADTG